VVVDRGTFRFITSGGRCYYYLLQLWLVFHLLIPANTSLPFYYFIEKLYLNPATALDGPLLLRESQFLPLPLTKIYKALGYGFLLPPADLFVTCSAVSSSIRQ
jgi:hypothetical protein